MQPTITPAGKYGPKHAADSEFVARKVAAFRAGAGQAEPMPPPVGPRPDSSDSDARDESDDAASDSGDDLAAALECVELTC